LKERDKRAFNRDWIIVMSRRRLNYSRSIDLLFHPRGIREEYERCGEERGKERRDRGENSRTETKGKGGIENERSGREMLQRAE
jgi:hypothetical protein